MALEFPEYNKVVYAILGNCCYFSGIERQYRTSTINAAASIVQSIAEQECIPIAALRWFDLQTYRGYEKRPGEYELDELAIGPTSNLQPTEGGITEFEVEGGQAILITQDTEDFRVTGWQPTQCPPEILELFRECIGEPRSLMVGLTPDEVRGRGYVAVDHDQSLDVLTSIAKTWMRFHRDFAVAVVDNEGFPEDLARAEGKRYTMWQKDETPP